MIFPIILRWDFSTIHPTGSGGVWILRWAISCVCYHILSSKNSHGTWKCTQKEKEKATIFYKVHLHHLRLRGAWIEPVSLYQLVNPPKKCPYNWGNWGDKTPIKWSVITLVTLTGNLDLLQGLQMMIIVIMDLFKLGYVYTGKRCHPVIPKLLYPENKLPKTPETNSELTLQQWWDWKTIPFLLKWFLFTGHVNFRGCTLPWWVAADSSPTCWR